MQKQCWTSSSIGRKQIVAATGLGLSLFVLSHMLGNLLILVGPQAYNEYSHKLISNPLIYVAEGGLLVMFVGHLALASTLALVNWRARPKQYAVLPNGDKGTSWIRRSLWAQGALILVFVILHLATFKYGPHYVATYDGVEMRDLHRLVIEVFHQPGYVVWYVVAVLVLGLHLSHGLGSTFQSLGFNHPRYQPYIRMLSVFYAIAVALGFAAQPLYVLFIHRG